MKRLRFDPRAQHDLDEAIRYYAGAYAPACTALLGAVDRVLELLCHHPEAGTLVRRGARKWPLAKFPYLIVYRVDGDELVVLAVVHMRRRPGFWQERLRAPK